MKMPAVLVRAWDALGDWSNVTVYERGRIEVRRIDILMFVMGVLIFFYYLGFYGWQRAVMGELMYIMVVMVALWML